MAGADSSAARGRVGVGEVLAQWGRIGCVGFGGPPTHIALLRDLCVDRKRWLDAAEFEDAIAACNLLPGPASTQLAILCAWSVAGPVGAVVGGVAFIVPGLVVILGLAAAFLAASPPPVGARRGRGRRCGCRGGRRARGYRPRPGQLDARSGAGPMDLLRAGGWRRGGDRRAVARGRLVGLRRTRTRSSPVRDDGCPRHARQPALAARGYGRDEWRSPRAVWVAVKVGALSYGGGFVIIPLMQHDAVQQYHWMTNSQFLDAVALGQITPGPVVQTVAVVGYAAAGVVGGLLAAVVAFAPSFVFVLGGARHFQALRKSAAARAFLDGAGPAAIGAIIGVAVPLGLALDRGWQLLVLGGAAVSLFLLHRSVIVTLLVASSASSSSSPARPFPEPQRRTPSGCSATLPHGTARQPAIGDTLGPGGMCDM